MAIGGLVYGKPRVVSLLVESGMKGRNIRSTRRYLGRPSSCEWMDCGKSRRRNLVVLKRELNHVK